MAHLLLRTLLAGLAGGIVLNGAIALLFGVIGFGWDGDGILVDPDVQSEKVIAVWTEMKPLPRIVQRPAPMVAGLILFGIAHAVFYRWLCPVWPPGVTARALRLALLVFTLSFLFWEFFTPFNLFGEPFPLIALELVLWALVALGEGFAVAGVMESSWK